MPNSSPSQLDILLLALDHQPWFDESYASLISAISAKAHLTRAKTVAGGVRYLSTHTPRAIIAPDAGIAARANSSLLTAVLDYVRNGGTLIIGLQFPSFIKGNDFERFFTRDLGLPWTRGDYHRTTFALNSETPLPEFADRSEMLPTYSMKALHVDGAPAAHHLYGPVADARTQSHVFAPAPVDQDQAAAVAAKVGEGFVIYIGDVNKEEGTERLILGICGLSS